VKLKDIDRENMLMTEDALRLEEDVELEEDELEEDKLEVSELEEDKLEEDEVFFELEDSELEEDKLVVGELMSAGLTYIKISDVLQLIITQC
jgi:hypothetical protein